MLVEILVTVTARAASAEVGSKLEVPTDFEFLAKHGHAAVYDSSNNDLYGLAAVAAVRRACQRLRMNI